MEYIAENTDFKLNHSAVTLGKFDGIHLGHQLLLDQVISYKKQGLTAVMFTFLFRPGSFLSEKEYDLIYSEEEKTAKLSRTELDVLVSYPFTDEIRYMPPEEFIQKILVDQLDAKVIVVGEDYKFGHNRMGDIKLLKSLAATYGYEVITYEKRKWNNTVISSSVIRNELKDGNLKVVNAMLGQPYFIRGEVMHGRKIGRTLGMPTTNIIPLPGKLLPPCGVYASITRIDGKCYPGVTNIGVKPTIAEGEKKGVETYLFDFDQDLYGKVIEVELHHYQRPEAKFHSLEQLKQKMQDDIITARKFFAGRE